MSPSDKWSHVIAEQNWGNRHWNTEWLFLYCSSWVPLPFLCIWKENTIYHKTCPIPLNCPLFQVRCIQCCLFNVRRDTALLVVLHVRWQNALGNAGNKGWSIRASKALPTSSSASPFLIVSLVEGQDLTCLPCLVNLNFIPLSVWKRKEGKWGRRNE